MSAVTTFRNAKWYRLETVRSKVSTSTGVPTPISAFTGNVAALAEGANAPTNGTTEAAVNARLTLDRFTPKPSVTDSITPS